MKILLKTMILSYVFICIMSFTVIKPEASQYIRFSNLTIEDGLSQGTVEVIMQDSEGYIWFGTNNGLNKYNGYDFTVYKNELEDDNSLQNDYILDLVEDLEGNIWVSTIEGISKINKETGKVDNYLINDTYICNVSALLLTSQGKVLAGSYEGLNIYNESEDRFESVVENNKLTNRQINGLSEDEYGNIWIATASGLTKLDLKTKETKKYKEFEGIDLYTVYSDDEYIWIGTTGNGAYKMNIKTEEVVRYYNISNDATSLAGDKVRSFLRDSKGNLWVCTSNGVSRFNEETNSFTNYKNKNYDSNSLVNNQAYSMIEDTNGLLWIGTYSGVSMFNPYSEIIHYKNDPFDENTISEDMIKGIYEDEEGLLWIGTNTKGVNVYDKENDIMYNLSTTSEKLTLSNDTINGISGYKQYVIISTYGGLNIIDKEQEKIYLIDAEKGIASNNVQLTMLDDEGRLWIGTEYGVNILDKQGKVIGNLDDIFEKFNISNRYVRAMFQDSKKNIWIGSFIGGGLLKINISKNTVVNYQNTTDINSISNNSIRCINEDSKGNIWIGTSGRLNKYIYEKDQFVRYTTSNGLPNNTIYGVLIDDEDNPWVSTNMGIAKYDIDNNIFIKYTVMDGLQSNEFNGLSYYKCRDGSLIFGGINGFNILNPKNLEKSEIKPRILVDKLTVNGVESDLKLTNLKSTDNNITIKFFTDNYKELNSYGYYYKLEDDHQWIKLNSNEINFINLAPGKYKYKFKVVNSHEVESDELELTIVINKPYWKSDLAITLYIFIVILVLIIYKRKIIILNGIVEQKTKKLKKEMIKNKELFNKNIELERNKNLYFINLSHELRTPLNVIYATQQLIKEINRVGISKEKIVYYMDVIERNTKRLLKIINDIIDSSKMESERYILNIEQHDIVYLVEETVLSLKDFIESKGIALIVDPDMEEKIIKCDSGAIERCIVNLVNNAGKFSNEGDTIKVKITEDNDKVIIKVIDTGIGIPEKYHDTIFNRFSQVIDENSENKGGSGLGLTITRQIVELHKGEIFVESEVGKGTTFTIILPVNI